jgi:hypothetical protein
MALAFKSGTSLFGLNYFGIQNTDWNLCTGAFGPRTFNKTIIFSSAFSAGPVFVVASLASFHAYASDGMLRLNIGVFSTTVNNFSCDIHTWDSTQVYGVTINWLAYTL